MTLLLEAVTARRRHLRLVGDDLPRGRRGKEQQLHPALGAGEQPLRGDLARRRGRGRRPRARLVDDARRPARRGQCRASPWSRAPPPPRPRGEHDVEREPPLPASRRAAPRRNSAKRHRPTRAHLLGLEQLGFSAARPPSTDEVRELPLDDRPTIRVGEAPLLQRRSHAQVTPGASARCESRNAKRTTRSPAAPPRNDTERKAASRRRRSKRSPRAHATR